MLKLEELEFNKSNKQIKNQIVGLPNYLEKIKVSFHDRFDFRETNMEIMIVLTISLLALVAVNEVTDH